jgi:secreted trypsin-like serine protease
MINAPYFTLVCRGQNNPWCGGTLISDRYVLTAAHCLRGKDALRKVEVVLADHDWTTKKEARDMRYRIVRAISHPKFDKVTKFDYDFALLKLDRSVDFTARRDVRPACLPQTATAVEMVGWRGTASGWGVVNPAKPNHQSRALRAVDVTVEPLDHCVDSYRPIGVTHNMFCAATPDGDACFGDSGGPFTVRRDGAYILEGVISWGRNCAKKRWPGVYARVRAALDWIKANSADSGFCPIDNEGRTIGSVKVEQEKDNDKKEDGHDSDGGWRFEERKLQE